MYIPFLSRGDRCWNYTGRGARIPRRAADRAQPRGHPASLAGRTKPMIRIWKMPPAGAAENQRRGPRLPRELFKRNTTTRTATISPMGPIPQPAPKPQYNPPPPPNKSKRMMRIMTISTVHASLYLMKNQSVSDNWGVDGRSKGAMYKASLTSTCCQNAPSRRAARVRQRFTFCK